MAKQNIKIKWVDFGIANNFGDVIEVHKDLKKYQNLLKPILRHEFAHSGKYMSWYDLRLDLIPDRDLNIIDLVAFMIPRPRTWTQFLPIYYQKSRGVVYDINCFIMWFTCILLTYLVVTILK